MMTSEKCMDTIKAIEDTISNLKMAANSTLDLKSIGAILNAIDQLKDYKCLLENSVKV